MAYQRKTRDVWEASDMTWKSDDFFDYLDSLCRQELIDKGTEGYDSVLKLSEIPDLAGCTEETMKQLIYWAD